MQEHRLESVLDGRMPAAQLGQRRESGPRRERCDLVGAEARHNHLPIATKERTTRIKGRDLHLAAPLHSTTSWRRSEGSANDIQSG